MALNERLINKVAVGVVFVNGPTPDLVMSLADKVNALTDIENGLTWLGTAEPAAKVTWVYDDPPPTVTIDALPWPNAPWPGMPSSFYQKDLAAALWRADNGRIYFFQGDQYVRFSSVSSGMDAGYPKALSEGWNGLPDPFQSGIQAALWRKSNGKIYFFRGDKYVRLTGTTVDPGYPKPIADGWPGLPEPFQKGIDAALMHHDNGRIYFFKGKEYVRYTNVSSGIDAGYPKLISEGWPGLSEEFHNGVHAALWRGSNSKVYLFSRPDRRTLTSYARFSTVGQAVDSGYPRFVGGLDKNEAEALWRDPAQAKLGVGPGIEGYKEYVAKLRDKLGTPWGFVAYVTRYPVGWSAYANTPRIVMHWTGTSDRFDRVFAHETGHMFGAPDEYTASGCTCDVPKGRFFKVHNKNCVPCTSGLRVGSGYPMSLSAAFSGLPTEFQSGVDAGLWRASNGRLYLFKGSQYVRLTGTTVDSGYPKSIAGNWNGLTASFQSDLDAAFYRGSNDRIYLFKGSQYVRLTGSTVDAGYPKSIAGNWNGLPAAFHSDLDAALWRASNGRIYLFKGGQYVRLDGTTVEAGYPKNIHPNWPGLPAGFRTGIDGAVTLIVDGKPLIHFFDGNQVVRFSPGAPCLMLGDFWTFCAHTPFHLGWGAFMERIDAALWRGDVDKTYLFSGKWYLRYSDISAGKDEGYPRTIAGRWTGLPPSFESDINAALWRPSNGRTYLFKGSQYVRLTGTAVDSGYPKSIAGNWNGLPAMFHSDLDAAFHRPSNGKTYMFKGDQYVRLTETTVDAGYPKSLAGNWSGLPASFQPGVDAVLWRESNGRIYMFKGTKYVRLTGTAVDSGYPKWIDGNWMPFPR
jgi:hypothetical protein